ncbi:MAG: methyltransferase domain-containing protein [Legionella sp.]|nr:methyltransferase domain-containing protein [Legionella sp.]
MTVTGVNLDEQRYRYRALDNWFKTPQGLFLGEAFSNQLSQFKHHLNQNILLQLGGCGENTWLSQNKFKHAWLSTPCLNTPNTSLIASPKQLPLDRNSVDVVIAPLIFEIFGQDESPLDEMDRVLNPMGHVIVFGINPLSFWGLSLASSRLTELGQAGMRPHSPWTLKRAFLNRGYQQQRFDMFYYVPPFQRKQWIKNSSFLNEMGKIMPVFPAGFYCLVMQKYEKLCAPPVTRSRQEPLLFPG